MSFKAPCPELCGKPLKRLHFTCLTCRRRRWANGSIHNPGYQRADIRYSVDYNQNGELIIPFYSSFYTLVIDNKRKYARIKKLLLRYVLTIAEALAN